MRKTILIIGLIMLAGGAYLAWPFWSAYQLRQAVKHADLATIERKVVWPSVRASLRASLLARLNTGPVRVAPKGPGTQFPPASPAVVPPSASGSPPAQPQPQLQPPSQSQSPQPPKTGSWRDMWHNVRDAITISVVDNTVDRMLTPRGLARLFAVRERYRDQVRPRLGLDKPASPFAGTWAEGRWIDRLAINIRRVKAINFTSLTRVEIEIASRYNLERHYIAAMQLIAYDWKLVGLRLVPPAR